MSTLPNRLLWILEVDNGELSHSDSERTWLYAECEKVWYVWWNEGGVRGFNKWGLVWVGCILPKETALAIQTERYHNTSFVFDIYGIVTGLGARWLALPWSLWATYSSARRVIDLHLGTWPWTCLCYFRGQQKTNQRIIGQSLTRKASWRWKELFKSKPGNHLAGERKVRSCSRSFY